MGRIPFKLKSQGSSFKAMGATPGESPLPFAKAAWKVGKYIWRKVAGTTKTKGGKSYKKYSDASNKTKTQYTKSGDLTKKSAEHFDEAMEGVSKYNQSITQASNAYTKLDAGIDLATLAAGVYMTQSGSMVEKKEDGSTVEVGPINSEVMWDDDSTGTETITPKKDTNRSTLTRE